MDAPSLWSTLPDAVRSEFDRLIHAGRRIRAVLALRDAVDPPPGIAVCQQLVAYRMAELGVPLTE